MKLDAVHATLKDTKDHILRCLEESRRTLHQRIACDLADEASANAQRLLADATLLSEHDRNHSAVALAIISLEEAGKSCLLRWQSAGLLTRSLSKDCVDHTSKQRVILAHGYSRAALEVVVGGHSLPEGATSSLATLKWLANSSTFNTLFTEALFDGLSLTNDLRFAGLYSPSDAGFEATSDDEGGVKGLFEWVSERTKRAIPLSDMSFAEHAATAIWYEILRVGVPRRRRPPKDRHADFVKVISTLSLLAESQGAKT